MPLTDWQFIQVVPRLWPGRCGVSDHALFLAEELKTAFGIDTAFLILNSNQHCSVPFTAVHCAPSELQQVSLSLSQGRRVALLVHLSGYGYAANGAPTLLAEALEAAKSDSRFRVAVFFHELYATGMPWRSAFWHSRKQKKALRRIAWECDLAATSISYFADWLERKTVRQSPVPIQVMPVFSCVGETAAPAPVAHRQPAMTVFGLGPTRKRAYKELSSLASLLHELGIREILDMGPGSEAPSNLNGIPIKRMGTLAASELGEQLSRTMFGFLSYKSPFLARSSVFAGYCAQGTIPVISESFYGDVDGLQDGVHLLSPATVRAVSARALEQCSNAAWRWYSSHRLHDHAATYARWVSQLEPSASE